MHRKAFVIYYLITLQSLCQDPASPGGPNPIYAPFAGAFSFSTSLKHMHYIHYGKMW